MSTNPHVNSFSNLNVTSDFQRFMEMRMENDANGNPIYIGYNKTPNASTAADSWYIIKVTYDGNQSPTYQQLPLNGVRFAYAWDDRATYF